MQFADLAFRQRYGRHADELQMFIEGRNGGLISGDAIQGFCQQNVELAGLGVLQK